MTTQLRLTAERLAPPQECTPYVKDSLVKKTSKFTDLFQDRPPKERATNQPPAPRSANIPGVVQHAMVWGIPTLFAKNAVNGANGVRVNIFFKKSSPPSSVAHSKYSRQAARLPNKLSRGARKTGPSYTRHSHDGYRLVVANDHRTVDRRAIIPIQKAPRIIMS